MISVASYMEISDLLKKLILYREHLFEVPVFSSLCDPLGVVLKGSEISWVLQTEGRMPKPIAVENSVCVYVCMCMWEFKENNTISVYSIHCRLLLLLCETHFAYFWVELNYYDFTSEAKDHAIQPNLRMWKLRLETVDHFPKVIQMSWHIQEIIPVI